MRYIKRPIEIEAMQFIDDESGKKIKEWSNDKVERYIEFNPILRSYLIISTHEGDMRADAGDWIIKGIDGEFYPCKDDIFKKTYEQLREHEIGLCGSTKAPTLTEKTLFTLRMAVKLVEILEEIATQENVFDKASKEWQECAKYLLTLINGG